MNAAYQSLCARLMMAGVPDARFDAAELYRFVTGRDPRLDDGPTAAEAARLRALAERRAAREPLQYMLGEWDFMDFTLKVGRGVLCPRADSEVVCEAAIELLKGVKRPWSTTSVRARAAWAWALPAMCPGAAVTCVEKSRRRLALPDRQCGGDRRAGTVQADVFTYYKMLSGEGRSHHLEPALPDGGGDGGADAGDGQEPAMALDGGADGLDFYRLLTAHYRDALRPGGWLVLEIGYAQAADVLALGAANGWVNGSCRKDYGGNDRAVLLQKPEKSC